MEPLQGIRDITRRAKAGTRAGAMAFLPANKNIQFYFDADIIGGQIQLLVFIN